MILSDFDLRNYIRTGRLKIIPFSNEIIRENGLDLRLGRSIARLKNIDSIFDIRGKIDVKKYYNVKAGDSFIIRPSERVLLHTLEYVKLPPELMGFVNLRSTYARLGLSIPPCLAEDTIVMDPVKGPLKAINAESVFSVDIESCNILHEKTRKYVSDYLGIMMKVRTKISEIVTTPNHRFIRFNPALTMEEAYASSLNEGDLLATVRTFSPSKTLVVPVLKPYPNLHVRVSDTLSSKIESKIREHGLTISETAKILGKHHKSYLINLLNNVYGVKWFFLEKVLRMLEIPVEKNLDEIVFYSRKAKKYLPLSTLYKRIDESLAYVIGYIVGDGGLSSIKSYKNVRLGLTDKNREQLEKVVNILRRKFDELADELTIERIERKYRVYIPTILTKTFSYNFGSGLRESRSREIPEKIRIAPNNIIASFIAGLFDAKGYSSNFTTYISTSSRVLAFQLQLLLLRLGIISRVVVKKTMWKRYQVIIQGKRNVEIFLNEICKYCSKPVRAKIKRETFDKIPLNFMLIEALKKLPHSDIEVRRKIDNYVYRRRVPYNKVGLVIKKLTEYKPTCYDMAIRDLLVLSKWFWDTVTHIEKMYYKEGKIVDWETTTQHYAAGVYVTHNTIIDGGFEGQLTIELIGGPFPVKLYAGERFIHVVFAKLTSPVEKPYTGKYQGQKGVTLPKL